MHHYPNKYLRKLQDMDKCNFLIKAQDKFRGESPTSMSTLEIVTFGTSIATRIRLLVIAQIFLPLLHDDKTIKFAKRRT